MNIILSAFSCNPLKGSEPSVGWNWVKVLLENNHNVLLLTSGNHNEKDICGFIRNKKEYENLRIIFCDLPTYLFKYRHLFPQLYYYLWQIKIYFLLKNEKNISEYNYIHHVTYVNARFPSFLCFLGIKFIFGPVSGGDCAPKQLRKSATVYNKLKYAARDLTMLLPKYDIFLRECLIKSEKIYVTSDKCREIFPKKIAEKVKKCFGISLDDCYLNNQVKIRDSCKNDHEIKLLYVGMLQHLKGIHLVIHALKNININYHFTIVGDGGFKRQLVKIVNDNNLNDKITFSGWVERDKLENIYNANDLFLFPSFQDSGGMALLEAMSYGLPCIGLDIGGPGEIIDNKCGIKIKVDGLSEDKIVNEISNSIIKIVSDKKVYSLASTAARIRAEEYTWQKKYDYIYENIIE